MKKIVLYIDNQLSVKYRRRTIFVVLCIGSLALALYLHSFVPDWAKGIVWPLFAQTIIGSLYLDELYLQEENE